MALKKQTKSCAYIKHDTRTYTPNEKLAKLHVHTKQDDMKAHKGTTKHKGQERMVMGWTLKPCTHDERQNMEHECSNPVLDWSETRESNPESFVTMKTVSKSVY